MAAKSGSELVVTGGGRGDASTESGSVPPEKAITASADKAMRTTAEARIRLDDMD